MLNKCKICSAQIEKHLYDLNKFKLFHCQKCGAIFIDPFLNDENIKNIHDSIYTQDSSEEKDMVKETLEMYSFDSDNCKLTDDHAHYLKIIEDHKNKGNLLDAGCGTGAFLNICKANGWEVSGVEISPQAAKFAQVKYNISVHIGKLEDIHFPNESYDVVTMLDVIEHVANPLDLISEAYRILNKDGLLFIALPNFDSLLGMTAHIIYKLSFGSINTPLKIIYPHTHFFYFTPLTIKKVLEEQNFIVQKIEQEDTDLKSLNINSMLYSALKVLFWVAQIIQKQNRMIIIARK